MKQVTSGRRWPTTIQNMVEKELVRDPQGPIALRYSKTLELCKWGGVPLGYVCLLCFFYCHSQDVMGVTQLLRTSIHSSNSESSQGQIQAILWADRGEGITQASRGRKPSPLPHPQLSLGPQGHGGTPVGDVCSPT